MSDNPLVSIIVRTKDRPKLLKRALLSIAGQTYRPIEVVLVNDGGCELDVEELKGVLGDVSLNYIRLEKNTGRAHAGNVGIENAKGEYIGFLDDDDELLPEHITTLFSFLIQSDYNVAYTDSFSVYVDYSPDTYQIRDTKREVVFSLDFDYDLLVFENYIPLMCLLFSRDVLATSGGFDSTFDLYEDWDLLIRIGEKHPFYHIRKVTAEYKQWSTELQVSQRNRDSGFLKQAYLKILTKHIDKITPQRVHDYMARSLSYRLRLKQMEESVETLKDTQIETLNGEIKKRDSAIENLKGEIQDRDMLITAMRNTRGWRALQVYRTLRDRIFGPRHREVREGLVMKGLRVLKNEGSRTLVQKANKKLLFSRSINPPPKPVTFSPLSISTAGETAINAPIRAKVSVIIPTKNAGDEFDYILRRITQQEGVEELELIVVDSGSSDRTLDICSRYTRNVVQIAPENFHHAKTRNLGADRATGDFLVFTVQDAIPVGNQWLYKLVSPVYEGLVSAVSARQIPRSDADIYAKWSYREHDLRYLRNDIDRIGKYSSENFDSLEIQEKRSIAGLDNACLGIPKATFDEYRFRSAYAEDFDLGIRLIKDGHSLLFQSSNAVIHSHKRPPVYFLKRSYVDAVSLSELLKTGRRDAPINHVMGAISFWYSALKMAIALLDKEERSADKPGAIMDFVSRLLSDAISDFDISWRHIEGDEQLDEYFRGIPPEVQHEMTSRLKVLFFDNLTSFSTYIGLYTSVEDIWEDFINSLYKVFCNTAGNFLGNNTHTLLRSLYEGI